MTPLGTVVRHAEKKFRIGSRRSLEHVVERADSDLVHRKNIAGIGSLIIDVVNEGFWVHILQNNYLTYSQTTRYRAPVSYDGIWRECQLLAVAGEVPREVRDRAQSLAQSTRMSFVGRKPVDEVLLRVDLVVVSNRCKESFRSCRSQSGLNLEVLGTLASWPATTRRRGDGNTTAALPRWR